MYISFYTAKVNQLALRFRQGGSEPAIQVPGVSAPQLQGLTRICLAKVVSWMLRGWRKRSRRALQMSKLKVTALSKCPRLYPPRAAMNEEEVRIQGQRLEVMR